MGLRIKQTFHYEGDDWWKWSVSLDAEEAELDEVQSVTYILHPTFQRPVREITTRANRFRLDSAGWGTFMIRARVLLKDKTEQVLDHELELLYPDGTPTTA